MAKKKTARKTKVNRSKKKPASKPRRAAVSARRSKTRRRTARQRPAATAARTTLRIPDKGLAPGYQWINAHLTVRNVQEAIDFYRNAFGFTLRMSMPGPEGKIMHAELTHRDSTVMLGPENPEMGALAPQGQSPVTLYVYVDNVDELATRASSNGAMLVKPPNDEFWGDRTAVIVDPQGHTWMFATHVKDVSAEDMRPPNS
jgi:PhnB protein